ncbi:MAG: transcription elongation factor GreA, partial [Bacteroidota bacterium]
IFSAMSDVKYMSKEGLEKLTAELADMKGNQRKAVAAEIQEAREKGDLSENAEYDAAKEKQGLLEMRIARLEGVLANARVLDESEVDLSKAYILSTVKLKNLKMKKNFTYTLVSEEEADLKTNRISVQSPVGKAILGKAVGDIVTIEVPAGKLEFEVLDITR